MKKRFAKLSKREQKKVEADYHNMSPHEFDRMMTKASLHQPNVKSTSQSAKKSIQKRGRLKPQASR
jgi:hypothetical protein